MSNSIKWTYAENSCEGLEECMVLIKTGRKDDGFLLGERADCSFQASGYGDGPYDWEIGFNRPGGAGVNWYGCPEEVSWDGLVDAARRFEAGEDFSFVKDKWECAFDSDKDREVGKRVFMILQIVCLSALIGAGLYWFLVKKG